MKEKVVKEPDNGNYYINYSIIIKKNKTINGQDTKFNNGEKIYLLFLWNIHTIVVQIEIPSPH